MEKKTIAVIFGGQSSEHEVSCKSVQNVAANIDTDRYDIIYIGITKEGRWLSCSGIESIKDGSWYDGKTGVIISPDAAEKCALYSDGTRKRIDVAFPVLHGNNGEDGTIQGIFEMARIPYVGCGVLSSAVTMDKFYTKLIVDSLCDVKQADYELVISSDLDDRADEYAARIEGRFAYPVFIKPAVGGSSCGVSRADNRQELMAGLAEAARFDKKILVEEMIAGREIECAVMGSGMNTEASGVGEILAAAEFYDYDAKYNNPASQTDTDPSLPRSIIEEIRKDAVEIFRALDGYGLSRVDFFVKEDGTVVFNEINTIPGFTAISMYPMLWEKKGISKPELIQRLIDLACARF